MFAMLKAFFTALQTLFMSLDTGARAINQVTTWAEEEAIGFNEKARLQREQALKVVRAQYRKENLVLEHDVRTTEAQLATAE